MTKRGAYNVEVMQNLGPTKKGLSEENTEISDSPIYVILEANHHIDGPTSSILRFDII